MMVPTLYVCHQVEQARREDERHDAKLWRLLQNGRKRERPDKAIDQRRSPQARRVKELLGSTNP